MAQSARSSKLESRSTRLKLPNGKRHHVRVGDGLILCYRRTVAGFGTWSSKIAHDGRYALRALGSADDTQEANGVDVLDFWQAQAKARDLATGAKVDAGILQAGPITLRQAIAEYAAGRESRKYAEGDRARLQRRLPQRLLDKPVRELTKNDIERWRNALVADGDAETVRRSKDGANRLLTILKAAVNHAFADEANAIPTDKPWRVVKAFRDVSARREDHFTEAQVLALIDAAREQDPCFADLCEAAFHTGARAPGELAQLDVQHFDARRAQIVIPDGKTGGRITGLTQEGVAFFARLIEGKRPRDILLARADGERWGKSEQHRPMKKALEAAGLPHTASLYTLRHSYVSRSIERGMPLTLVAENVGTSVRMIEQNYGKFIAQTRRELIEKTAPVLRVVKGIATPKDAGKRAPA